MSAVRVKADKSVKMKKGEFFPEFAKRAWPDLVITEDDLFLDNSLLSKVPTDWIDCVMFCVSQNYRETGSSHLIILNDEQTAKALEFVDRSQFNLFVIENDSLWHVRVVDTDGKRLFLGGENLRKFCDDRNIFYKSILHEGKLLSGSDMLFVRKEGEDCRIPAEE